jgi:enoyl-CoA hydratase/carnithine racemase
VDTVLASVADGIATITLNRPAKRNAVDRAMRRELARLVSELDGDPAVRVFLLAANGPSFCVGHDVTEPSDGAPQADFLDLFGTAATPSVAAVQGPCAAGGASLALGCDIRFAAPEATIGWTQPRLGLVPVSGPCLLPRLVPSGVALRHLLTGKPMTAAVAARWGLVEDVVPAGELLATARACAAEVVACAPLAVAAVRRSARSVDLPLAEQLDRTRALADAVAASADAREGVAAFRAKRTPGWTGR